MCSITVCKTDLCWEKIQPGGYRTLQAAAAARRGTKGPRPPYFCTHTHAAQLDQKTYSPLSPAGTSDM